MARAGISYSNVAKAAAQLASAGKNPTVDTVRAALGGTGSKSTITPLLKQWKAQHGGEMAAANAGLPADLLDVVKGVYERLQEAAGAKVAQARAEYQLAVEEAERIRAALHAETSALGAERDALAAELDSVKAELMREQVNRQRDAVTIAALEADNNGYSQRLADRAAEVKALVDQLTQTRRQFEHFQDAIANQRQEEKHAYEARISRAEQEAATLRGFLQDGREALAVIRSEKVQLEHALVEQHNKATEQSRMLHDATAELAGAREMVSVGHFEVELVTKRLDDAESENARLTALVAKLQAEAASPRRKSNPPAAKGRSTSKAPGGRT